MPPPKYVPKPPQVNFGDIVKARHERLANKYPSPKGQCLPHEAHFNAEQLEANVFCRVLAAKPKMDAKTRLVLPSTLLSKVGLTKDGFLGAVNPVGNLRGQRFYLGGQCKEIPISVVQKLRGKNPEYSRIPIQKNFKSEARQVLVDEINHLASIYEPVDGKPLVCKIVKGNSNAVDFNGNIPVFTIAADDISSPESTVSTSDGMKLAGCIYKFILFNH